MTILILGAGGLIGHHLTPALAKAGHAVVARPHAELDITDPIGAVETLEEVNPALVINAAGLVNFAACEADPEASRRINLEAPLRWAGLCADRGIPFWAFSSDYVFDGLARTPYAEEATPHPRSVYARDKAALEARMTEYSDHLTLRVSWVYGSGGKTFMSLLPGLLATREELTVASGKRGSCLYAADAADLLCRLLPHRPTGILNLVNTGEASWESFAIRCLDRMQILGMPVTCRRIRQVSYRTLASDGSGERPEYSVLSTARIEGFGWPVPGWESAQDRFLAEARHPQAG